MSERSALLQGRWGVQTRGELSRTIGVPEGIIQGEPLGLASGDQRLIIRTLSLSSTNRRIQTLPGSVT